MDEIGVCLLIKLAITMRVGKMVWRQVQETRGGGVLFERESLGGIFVGVIFDDEPSTMQVSSTYVLMGPATFSADIDVVAPPAQNTSFEGMVASVHSSVRSVV